MKNQLEKNKLDADSIWENHKEFKQKINWYNSSKDLEAKIIMYLLRKLIRLHWVITMIK